MTHIAANQERILEELSVAALDKLGHRQQVLDERGDEIALGSLIRDGTDLFLCAQVGSIDRVNPGKLKSELTLSNKQTVLMLVSWSLEDSNSSVPVDSIKPSIEQ